MPVVKIDYDELYPFYFLYDKGHMEIEVTDEEYTWIVRTERRFTEVQEFLNRKYTEGEE